MEVSALQARMLSMLTERGSATMCPSEIARAVAPEDKWRELMPTVRAAAAQLQARGKVDAYQHGKPIRVTEAKGPIRLRASDLGAIDHRQSPERYRVGRGEEGVLTVEPYKSELLPLWRFRTPQIAEVSARALFARFLAYVESGDFVGMDMARKYLQMGWTRARRYANHAGGRKYGPGRSVLPSQPDAEKARAAEIFKRYYDRARNDPRYAQLLKARRAEEKRHPVSATVQDREGSERSSVKRQAAGRKRPSSKLRPRASSRHGR